MISLAMPTYNGEKYLREQLDSIYAQTMLPDEVVVVDDCSTDGTVNILEEYKQKYGLKYYVNEKNLGYNKNFEKAINLCSGDYIALSDQDDVWLPEKIEKTYRKLSQFSEDEPSLVSSFGYITDENLNIKYETQHVSGDWKLHFFQYDSQGCTLMFNKALKDVILPFHPDIIYDAYIGLTASIIGNRYYIGENLMYYRIHSSNAFASNDRKSKTQSLVNMLHYYVPGWFSYVRFRYLFLLKNKYKNNISLKKLEIIDQVLRIYQVSSFKRIFLFASIKEIPWKKRFKTCLLLTFKFLFRIKDIY